MNWLFKRLGDLCEVYAFNKYILVSMIHRKICLRFDHVITIVVSRYSVNEISKCFA